MYQRKRAAIQRLQRDRKRRKVNTYRSGGLVPRYSGFTPRSFSRGEWKYKDVLEVTAGVDATGDFTLLNGLFPGTGASQRVGQKISIVSFEARLQNYVTSNTGVAQTHRIILFVDKQSNGADCSVADVLNGGTTIGFRDLTNRKRFKILWDKTITFPKATLGGNDRRYTHKYIKMTKKPIIVDYNAGNSGNYTDISTNALWVLMVGSEAVGLTAGACNCSFRIRYIDN